ncbi:MAG: RsmE family RNA methyltransferase [Candidatus Marinimicrobia bacterium]|nr:RsmE family RNA methyltransferase [Candidatus Neomarinimicrobiota bacterium]
MITGEQVYLPTFQKGLTSLTLTGSEYHHLIRVRRFKVGSQIWVVDGRGTAALTRIKTIRNDTLDLTVLAEEPGRGELTGEIILAIANLKGDHMNLIVEKATELGVHQIVPLLTEHTVKQGMNHGRLQRIAIAAMKQSRRSFLPVIHELTGFPGFVRTNRSVTNLFCYAADTSTFISSNQTLIRRSGSVVIWIGPEGDWSKDEIDLASVSDYTFTGLGPRRLRAETAAIHAAGLVSALLQESA